MCVCVFAVSRWILVQENVNELERTQEAQRRRLTEDEANRNFDYDVRASSRGFTVNAKLDLWDFCGCANKKPDPEAHPARSLSRWEVFVLQLPALAETRRRCWASERPADLLSVGHQLFVVLCYVGLHDVFLSSDVSLWRWLLTCCFYFIITLLVRRDFSGCGNVTRHSWFVSCSAAAHRAFPGKSFVTFTATGFLLFVWPAFFLMSSRGRLLCWYKEGVWDMSCFSVCSSFFTFSGDFSSVDEASRHRSKCLSSARERRRLLLRLCVLQPLCSRVRGTRPYPQRKCWGNVAPSTNCKPTPYF